MSKIECPYLPCGGKEECIGCCHDPEQRPITLETFRDFGWETLRCNECRYHTVNADQDGCESKCKRLDHKHIQFYYSWFKTYDCNGNVCSDFEPKENCKFLHRHWNPILNVPPKENKLYCFFLDGNRKVAYYVRALDFFYNNFLDHSGKLRWIAKLYPQKTKKSPFGYVYMLEYPDGSTIRYKGHIPIKDGGFDGQN